MLILSDILQMLITHSENVNRFFVVEENNARSRCVIYFRDYLSRSVLDGVGKINSISSDENNISESLNRMEMRVFLLSQIHVGIRLEDVVKPFFRSFWRLEEV